MNLKEKEEILAYVRKLLVKSCITVTEKEFDNIEVSDLGLGIPKIIGHQIIVYVNNEKYCAKEIILLPNQIIPEHKHPPITKYSYPGKTETFRCRYGEVYLYVEGVPVLKPKGKVPKNKEKYFTVWHELILKPGEQYTILPNTKHWFQSGKEGAVVSEFSSTSYDEYDVFTDPDIIRIQ